MRAFFPIILLVSATIISSCGPTTTAFMTGLTEGMTENISRFNSDESLVQQTTGMSRKELRRQIQRGEDSLQQLNVCSDRSRERFLESYPEYFWATKNLSSLRSADFVDKNKISGMREYEGLLKYLEDSENCVDIFFNTNMDAQGFLGEVFVLAREYVAEMTIVYARYLNQSLSRGQVAQKRYELNENLDSQIMEVLEKLKDRKAQIKNRQLLAQQTRYIGVLKEQNNIIITDLRDTPYGRAKAYLDSSSELVNGMILQNREARRIATERAAERARR